MGFLVEYALGLTHRFMPNIMKNSWQEETSTEGTPNPTLSLLPVIPKFLMISIFSASMIYSLFLQGTLAIVMNHVERWPNFINTPQITSKVICEGDTVQEIVGTLFQKVEGGHILPITIAVSIKPSILFGRLPGEMRVASIPDQKPIKQKQNDCDTLFTVTGTIFKKGIEQDVSVPLDHSLLFRDLPTSEVLPVIIILWAILCFFAVQSLQNYSIDGLKYHKKHPALVPAFLFLIAAVQMALSMMHELLFWWIKNPLPYMTVAFLLVVTVICFRIVVRARIN